MKNFENLTKKEKLEMKPVCDDINDVKRAVFIPLREKNSGWSLCAFFVQDKQGKWFRKENYDCFRFMSDNLQTMPIVRGDFENHGVQFFLEECNGGTWCSRYGGELYFKQK